MRCLQQFNELTRVTDSFVRIRFKWQFIHLWRVWSLHFQQSCSWYSPNICYCSTDIWGESPSRTSLSSLMDRFQATNAAPTAGSSCKQLSAQWRENKNDSSMDLVAKSYNFNRKLWNPGFAHKILVPLSGSKPKHKIKLCHRSLRCQKEIRWR